MTEPDVTPEDALEIAKEAVRRVNELEQENQTLREQVEHLEDQVADLEVRVEDHYENTNYEQLTLSEKVQKVRHHAYEKAVEGRGMTKLDYNAIMWEVFNGEPGTKHCYKLIRKAAGLDDRKTGSEVPGFTARDPDGESYHLAVDASRVNEHAMDFPENKTQPAGAD